MMEPPLFYGQPVLDFRIPKVPDGFHLIRERRVSYEVYRDFHEWGMKLRLFDKEFVGRTLLSKEFDEYEYYVPTEAGWRSYLEAARNEPEDLVGLRTYNIGEFYLREENYVLFRLKFDGVKA